MALLGDATRKLTDEAGTTTQANAAMAFAMWRAKVAVEFTPVLPFRSAVLCRVTDFRRSFFAPDQTVVGLYLEGGAIERHARDQETIRQITVVQ